MELCLPPRAFSSLPHHRPCNPNPSLLLPRTISSFSFKKPTTSRSKPGLGCSDVYSLRATTTEETSTAVSEPFERAPDEAAPKTLGEASDGTVETAEVLADGEQNEAVDFLSKLDLKETSTDVSESFGVALDEVTLPIIEKARYETISLEDAPEGREQNEDGDILNKLNLKLDSEDTYSILIYGTGALVALWILSSIVGAFESLPLFPRVMEIVGLVYTIWFSSRYLIFKKNREELFAKIEDLKEQIIGPAND